MKATLSILAIAISLGLSSCKKEKGANVEPDRGRDEKVGELEEQVGELRQKLVDEQNLRLRQNHEQSALLADMRKLLKEMAEVKEAPAPAKVIPLAKIEAEKEAMDPDAEARRVSRLRAQGELLAELVTRSGAQYKDLVITKVTDLGVVFRHKGGIARVPFTDLDATWQKRFYHDQDRAIAALKKERIAQANYNRAVAANIKAMEEKGKGDDLNLGEIARAVARINQPNPVNTTIIEERIHVDPPIVLNNDHHYHDGYYDENGFYCPPVVRPLVVRTPVVRTPVIRTRPDAIPVARPVTSRVKPAAKPTVRPTPKPTIRPTVRPTPRPTVQRPATPRPTTVRPATQRPRPTSRPTPSRPQARPTPQPRPSRVRTNR